MPFTHAGSIPPLPRAGEGRGEGILLFLCLTANTASVFQFLPPPRRPAYTDRHCRNFMINKVVQAAALSAAATVVLLSPVAAFAQNAGPNLTFKTFAGPHGPDSDDGLGNEARFNQPFATAADAVGNTYVADTYNHTIRKITSDGQVSTVAGLAG